MKWLFDLDEPAPIRIAIKRIGAAVTKDNRKARRHALIQLAAERYAHEFGAEAAILVLRMFGQAKRKQGGGPAKHPGA